MTHPGTAEVPALVEVPLLQGGDRVDRCPLLQQTSPSLGGSLHSEQPPAAPLSGLHGQFQLLADRQN